MIRQRTLPPPPIRRREILRYMGASASTPELEALMDRALSLLEGRLCYRVCYREVPVVREEDGIRLLSLVTPSQTVARALEGCKTAVLFAATVGLDLDRLIARYGRVSPSRGLMMQALGAERIEALCDAFCNWLAEEYAPLKLRRRFSPGYGDLPLEGQRAIFDALQCHKEIGLYLNGSYLMSPTKSVTAIVGIGGAGMCQERSCAACGKKDCDFRKE